MIMLNNITLYVEHVDFKLYTIILFAVNNILIVKLTQKYISVSFCIRVAEFVLYVYKCQTYITLLIYFWIHIMTTIPLHIVFFLCSNSFCILSSLTPLNFFINIHRLHYDSSRAIKKQNWVWWKIITNDNQWRGIKEHASSLLRNGRFHLTHIHLLIPRH